MLGRLQQSLPFTVLKPKSLNYMLEFFKRCNSPYRLRYWNSLMNIPRISATAIVATVLTVYGIETCMSQIIFNLMFCSCNSPYRLRYWNLDFLISSSNGLSCCNSPYRLRYWNNIVPVATTAAVTSCNSPYRLRYWNETITTVPSNKLTCCNSTYCLRYWNDLVLALT